jgi:hypothetical protein
MTREQALAGPVKPLLFEITAFIVANDPHVLPFLEGGVATQSPYGE